MTSIEAVAANLRRLDQFARADTVIHRLDPRAKVVATLAFVVAVASFDKYTVAALMPFAVFPIVLAALGRLPVGYLARNVALAIPFALVIGLFNPFFEREVVLRLGPLPISAGWISCASIVARALLTLAAALVLVAVTGFPAVCEALERLGMPRVFAVQLQFVYRYLFVLVDDGARSTRALALRACGNPLRPRLIASLLGLLLLRTWQRAERIHMAMLARAYDGTFHKRTAHRFAAREVCFVLAWIGIFALLRYYDVAQLLGALLTRALP